MFRVGSYLTDDVITIGVADGATPDEIAVLLDAAINAKPNLPFTSTVLAGVVTCIAKADDISGEDLLITFNQRGDDDAVAPETMTVVVAQSVSAVGKSDLANFWSYIGAESSPWNTSIVTPYGDTLELDGGSTAIGNPNDQSGNYDARDYRPATIWTADTTPGEAGLTAALAVADPRSLDAANIRLEAPDYPELGYEIAAGVSGAIEVASMAKSASAYTKVNLPFLYGPLDPTKDWTTFLSDGKSYNNRDLAVKGGLTPIIYLDNMARPGDVTGFWQPQDNKNAPFVKQVNRWKSWSIQNLYNIYINGDDNKDRPIVESAAATDQDADAIDEDILTAGLAQVTGVLARAAWIFTADFTIRNSQVIPSVSNPDRFDFILPVVLSGNNRINLGEIQIDTDPSVVTLIIAVA